MKLLQRLGASLRMRHESKGERQNPSVDQFGKLSDLREAMGSDDLSDGTQSVASSGTRNTSSQRRHSASKTSKKKTKKENPVGWKLAVYDKNNSEPQTMEEECKRLQVLQSYFILDCDGEAEFDRITKFTAKLFDVPIAVVSMVDLGRQWFLSEVGLNGATETSREIAFCAHAVISKHQVFVVPDALQDFRFKNSPLVTGGPKVRFYAGAPLMSPEGYKLGVLCIKDTKPRPQGLTENEQIQLSELSKMVVSLLVARRDRLLLAHAKDVIQDAGEGFASTVNMLSKAAKVAEDFLASDEKNRDAAMLSTVTHELRLQEKICRTTARSFLEKEGEMSHAKQGATEDHGWATEALSMYDELLEDTPTTDIQKLFSNLSSVVATLAGKTKVSVEVKEGVPNKVSGDDLLLFRSTLNLLLNGIKRSENGSVHLRISCRNSTSLLFECEDTGTLISKEKVSPMWKQEPLLIPIRSLVRSVGGNYGIGSSRLDAMEAPPKNIFWFKTPNEIECTMNEMLSEPLKATHNLQEGKSIEGKAVDPFTGALLHEGCVPMDALNRLQAYEV